MTGPAERARLAELARAATPGPWAEGGPDIFEGNEIVICVMDSGDDLLVEVPTGVMADVLGQEQTGSQAVADAAYIAAVSPDVILALLARLAALEAALAEIAEDDAPISAHIGRWDGWREVRRLRDIAAAALRALDGTEGQ